MSDPDHAHRSMSRPVVIGVDPSTTWVGWALAVEQVPVAAGAELRDMDKLVVAIRQALEIEALDKSPDLANPAFVIAIEQHTFTMARGNDGLIAWRLGWSAAQASLRIELMLREVYGPDVVVAVRKAGVSSWRSRFLQTANAHGLDYRKPTKKGAMRMLMPGPFVPADKVEVDSRAGLAVIIRYVKCGHTYKCRDLAHLRRRPNWCPTCTGNYKPQHAVGIVWKRMAYDGCEALWPGLLVPVLERAQGRARKGKLHAAEYSGVADAAEAVWIAHWGATSR